MRQLKPPYVFGGFVVRECDNGHIDGNHDSHWHIENAEGESLIALTQQTAETFAMGFTMMAVFSRDMPPLWNSLYEFVHAQYEFGMTLTEFNELAKTLERKGGLINMKGGHVANEPPAD